MNKTRILIAEDHELFRKGLRAVLEKHKDFEVVGEAADGYDIIQLAREVEADLIIMDLHLPQFNGVEACRTILEETPELKILGLSYEIQTEAVFEMIKSGVSGYLSKDGALDELILAIKAIRGGGSYFSKGISLKLFSRNENQETSPSEGSLGKLTKREIEILSFIANEHTNKEIAEKLFISPRTVETHRRNLIQKLKVKNTVGLIKYFLNNPHKVRV